MAGTCIARHTLRIERPCYIQNAKRGMGKRKGYYTTRCHFFFYYFVSIFVLANCSLLSHEESRKKSMNQITTTYNSLSFVCVTISYFAILSLEIGRAHV